jgi:type II secretory pathway pseudopilin PulG
MPRPHAHRLARDDGWTLIETMFVMLIIGTVAATTVMVMPRAVTIAKADSTVKHLESVLRRAREQSISQRRNVRVVFNAPNTVQVLRVEVTNPVTTTPLSETILENGAEFRLFAGIGDTPDAFGNATAIAFGTATSVQFTSEGTFVDQVGDEINGTVFIGVPNQPDTARAVSIFGPTALIRSWNWDGRSWTN